MESVYYALLAIVFGLIGFWGSGPVTVIPWGLSALCVAFLLAEEANI